MSHLLTRVGPWAAVAVLVAACGGDAPEADAPASEAGGEPEATTLAEREAAVPSNPLKDAYFGELHIHTAYSLDAYIFGNTLNDPFVAYRFARGEEVDMPAGGTKRITEPLDFAAITDHAEALGEYELCTNPQSSMYDSEACAGVRGGDMQVFEDIFAGIAVTPATRLESICGADGSLCEDAAPAAWQRVQEAAAQNYDPGTFTSLVAYEYSANAPEGQGGMMHRNVIFASDDVPATVFSAFDGMPEELHLWLEQSCTGDCRVLTIPHNPNFYWGRLYWGRNADGSEWTQEQVDRRARMDRLVEIMQVKGNSECQVGIGTTDEACNFELVFEECPPGENAGCNDFNSFVRNGLKLGLRYEQELGTNPFKHGIIASTDNHNGTPSDTDESTFMGHYANNDADPEVRLGLRPNPTAEAMGPAMMIPPGSTTLAGSPASGPSGTRATPSGRACTARRPSAPAGPASGSACSAASGSPKRSTSGTTGWRWAMPRAYPRAETCQPLRTVPRLSCCGRSGTRTAPRWPGSRSSRGG